jgi:hypothetical protein
MMMKWKMMILHDRSVMLSRSLSFSLYKNLLTLHDLGDTVLRYEGGVPRPFLSSFPYSAQHHWGVVLFAFPGCPYPTPGHLFVRAFKHHASGMVFCTLMYDDWSIMVMDRRGIA